MSEKVLLVGNGINNASKGYKWADLIGDLMVFGGRAKDIEKDGKPFALLYEEMVFKTTKNRLNEQELKRFIASRVKSIEQNDVHAAVVESSISTILTTNYDHNLEIALGAGTLDLKNAGVFKERRYNLFRVFNVAKKRIWHIHGECNASASIILGYEQYCGYLQYMRNYVVTGTGDAYSHQHFDGLRLRMKKPRQMGFSWVDHFFTSDIYVLGLTMDFVEMHLWWLITYRAREIRRKKLPIENRIVFFVPRQYMDESKARFQLLQSCNVTVVPLDYDRARRIAYYAKALRIIKNSM